MNRFHRYNAGRKAKREELLKKIILRQKKKSLTIIGPKIDIKRTFYKWLVLTKKEFVRRTLEKMLKNCKINEGKAAYIFWRKIQVEKAPKEEIDPLKLNKKQKAIYSATFQLVKFFERKNRENCQEAMRVLTGDTKEPLARLVVTRYTKIWKLAYDKLAKNTLYNRSLKFYFAIEKILKPKIDPKYTALWRIKLHSERKARRTEGVVNKLENFINGSNVREMTSAFSSLRKIIEYQNRVRILEMRLEQIFHSYKQGTFSTIRGHSMENTQKEKSTIYMHNVLKSLINKYMAKPSMDKIKATVFKKRHAVELLGNSLQRIFRRNKKDVFYEIKEEFYSMLQISINFQFFALLGKMENILQDKVKENFNEILVKRTINLNSAESILEQIIEKHKSKLRKALRRLVIHNRIRKNIRSLFLKYANNSDDLKREAVNRLRTWNREVIMGLAINDEARFHCIYRFNSCIRNLVERKKKASLKEFLSRLKFQDMVKGNILKKIVERNKRAKEQTYGLLKGYAERMRVIEQMRYLLLSKLFSRMNKSLMDRVKEGLNCLKDHSGRIEQMRLLALSKVLPENSAKQAFDELVKNANNLAAYQELLLNKLIEKYHPSDHSLLQKHYKKLKNWKDSFNLNKAREMKLKFILSRKFTDLNGITRAFDIWKKVTELGNEYERNNVNWAVSLQYMKSLDSLASLVKVKKLRHFKDFKNLTFPGISKKEQIIAKFVERMDSKKMLGFEKLKINFLREEIILRKVVKVFQNALKHHRNCSKEKFDQLRNWNKASKLKKFVKVLNFNGGSNLFNKLRVHTLEERAKEIEHDYKCLNIFDIIENIRLKRLASSFRNFIPDFSLEEKIKNMFNLMEKACLANLQNPLKRAFDIWKLKTEAQKQIQVASKLASVETLNRKNREHSKIMSMERLRHFNNMLNLREDMTDILRDTELRSYNERITRQAILRLFLSQYSKLSHSFSLLKKNKILEKMGDRLVLKSFTKTIALWNSKLKSKLRDAFNKLDKNSMITQSLYLKQKWMIDTFVEKINSQKLKHALSKMRTNHHDFSKRIRLRNAFLDLAKRASKNALEKMRKEKIKQERSEMLVLYLNQIFNGNRAICLQSSFKEIKDNTKNNMSDLAYLVSVIEKMLNSSKRKGFDRMLVHGGFRQEKGSLLLQRILHRGERRHTEVKSAAFTILRTQDIIKDLTLLYYFSFNKLMTLFQRKKQAAFYEIKTQERLIKCKSYFNHFWNWKLKNLKERFIEEEYFNRRQRLFNRFYLSKAVSAIENIFKKSKRSAMSAIKEDTGFGDGRGLYTYNDINTVVKNTALLSGIYSMLKKKKILLLQMSLKRWKENSEDEGYSFTSHEKSGFIDSLYKKSEMGAHYKRWLYCARLAKIIEKCIIQRKIDFFNELVHYHGQNDDSVLIKEDFFTNTLINKANMRLKFKMGFVLLTSIFNSKKSSNFSVMYRFEGDSRSVSRNSVSQTSKKSFRNTYSRNATGTRLVRKGDNKRLNKTYTVIKRSKNNIYDNSVGETGTALKGKGMSRGIYSQSNYGFKNSSSNNQKNNFVNIKKSDGSKYDFKKQHSTGRIGNWGLSGKKLTITSSSVQMKYVKLLNGIISKVINKAKQRVFNIVHEVKIFNYFYLSVQIMKNLR